MTYENPHNKIEKLTADYCLAHAGVKVLLASRYEETTHTYALMLRGVYRVIDVCAEEIPVLMARFDKDEWSHRGKQNDIADLDWWGKATRRSSLTDQWDDGLPF